MDADRATGAAKRRRQRRLRSWWRHEQQTVVAVLATVTHHSFQVGTPYDALRSQKLVTSTRGTPPPLVEGRPQERVQRHTAEHIVDVLPCVQILDVPVPQAGEQLVDIIRLVDMQTPVEHVIELPKISSPSRCARC